jgi:CO/xanthine dehydrogenase FAD-binding subunit
VALALGPAGARVAAGSVAERTLRLAAVERAIEAARRRGAAVDDGARREFAAALRRAAEADVRPRDDVRSTARYRRTALGNVLVRMLDLESIRQGTPA